MKDIKTIIEKIENFEYVSFDVFDTLIVRNVKQPRDIYSVVDFRIKKELHIDNISFVDLRITAEKKAISKSKNEEITLDDIYDNIDCKEKQKIKSFEIETEIDFCQLNHDFIRILDYCQKDNKKIVIISDMYLSKETIEEILNKAGICYFEVFVSSEYKKRKSRGTLYRKVVEELGIEKSSIIHIGDNWKSDYLIPKLLGIKAIHYKRKYKEKKNIQTLQEGIIDSIITNNVSNDVYYNIGYEVFGPLLYGFTSWISTICEEKNVDKIFFLSRDGYIVQQAYDVLSSSKVKSDYLYVSRRSLTVPMLCEVNSFEEIIKTVPYIKRVERTKDLLYKIGVEDPIFIKKIEQKFGDSISKEELKSNIGKEIFDEIKTKMHENAIFEKDECSKYFKNYFECNKSYVFVDLGWYGTIQKTFEDLKDELGIDCQILGLYLGKLQRYGMDKEMKGYVYDYSEEKSFDENLIFGFNGLIESFFTANHGSTKKYVNGKPVLDKTDLEDWDIIQKMHVGALDFLKMYNRIIPQCLSYLDDKIAYKNANRLFTKPTKSEVTSLGNIIFYDVYSHELITYHGLKFYLKHPKQMIVDMSCSNWKIGYLKRLFKISLPYDQLYLQIRKRA